jgi:hypothetical protein
MCTMRVQLALYTAIGTVVTRSRRSSFLSQAGAALDRIAPVVAWLLHGRAGERLAQ